jgi:hypothetical protein
MKTVSKREELRESYMQGWYRMDLELLLSSTSSEFVFDDPAEPGPVTRTMLANYMQRWHRRTCALGADNQWKLTHESRQDKDGILTDWEWWEVIGTDLQGAAIILTSDDGVLFERITYFERNLPRAWAT